MDFRDLLKQKKNGLELTDKQIEFWIDGVTNQSIPDYQLSALLMAIYFTGMTVKERSILTKCMAKSGKFLDFSQFTQPKVDKHSTGGVGDKTSLIISPLIQQLGFLNPMVSGRGLGHTGGTVDKLESIPGYITEISLEQMEKQIKDVGNFIAGQTKDIAPADKVIYSLRDVTETVQETSLITASILSKKFASGLDTLTLDVKCGSGAFLETFESAVETGLSLVHTANKGGVKCNGVITRMDYPLGEWSGNLCEVFEVYECLRPGSKYTQRVQEGIQFNPKFPQNISIDQDNKVKSNIDSMILITYGLIMNMLQLVDTEAQKAHQMIKEHWVSGKAFEQFKKWVSYQGGDLEKMHQRGLEIQNICNEAQENQQNENVYIYNSKIDGKIESLNGIKIGFLLVELGAGRKVKTDVLNHDVSMQWLAHPNQELKKGQPIAKFYHPDSQALKNVDIEKWLDENIKFTQDMSYQDDIPFIHYVLKDQTTEEEANLYNENHHNI